MEQIHIKIINNISILCIIIKVFFIYIYNIYRIILIAIYVFNVWNIEVSIVINYFNVCNMYLFHIVFKNKI